MGKAGLVFWKGLAVRGCFSKHQPRLALSSYKKVPVDIGSSASAVYSCVMSQESFVFLVGLVVLATPLLGIPHEWKDTATIVAGILLLIAGYRLRRAAYIRSLENEKGERRGDAFVENNTEGALEPR